MASKATLVLNSDVNFLLFISTKLSGFLVLTSCPNFWGNYSLALGRRGGALGEAGGWFGCVVVCGVGGRRFELGVFMAWRSVGSQRAEFRAALRAIYPFLII
jgi:hypothetical protein